jgi:hypothetical protein
MLMSACEDDASGAVMSATASEPSKEKAQDAGPKPKRSIEEQVRDLDLLPEDAERLKGFRDAPAWEIGYYTQSCFGRCPVYEIMLDQAGNLYYDGRGNVAVYGTHELTTDAAAVRALYDKLLDIGFLRLRDTYETGADGCIVFTDNPTQTMRLTIPEDNKPLRYYNGCFIRGPAYQALEAIRDSIDMFPPVQRLTAAGNRYCGKEREHTLAQAVAALGDETLSYVLIGTDGDSKDKQIGVIELEHKVDEASKNKRTVLSIRDCQGKDLSNTTDVSTHTCGILVKPDENMKLSWPDVDLAIHAALIGIEDIDRDSDNVDYNVRLLSFESEVALRARKGDRCQN